LRFTRCNMIIKFQPVCTPLFWEDRGEVAGFKHAFILILAVRPIPCQLLLVIPAFAIFSGIEPCITQTQHCTSKWFYLLTKTTRVLCKYKSYPVTKVCSNSHSRTGQISGMKRGIFEVLYYRKTKVNISFKCRFLLNSDQLRAWMS
jgi:hypothetical protein